MKRGRLVALAALVGGVAFGAFGGEYRSIDYWRLKRDVRQVEQEIVDLERAIDSLEAFADSLETDSATQERVARERFGMLRHGEILYIVADSGRTGTQRPD